MLTKLKCKGKILALYSSDGVYISKKRFSMTTKPFQCVQLYVTKEKRSILVSFKEKSICWITKATIHEHNESMKNVRCRGF